MFEQQQSGKSSGLPDFRSAMNIVVLLMHGHATCLTVFLRHSFGSEALGINGIAAVVVMVLYMTAFESRGMIGFLQIWFMALILQRLRTFWLSRKGVGLHSHYGGSPWLGNLMTLGLSDSAARIAEGLFCLFFGAWVAHTDPILGRFIALGLVSLLVTNGVDDFVHRRKLRQMRDAEIEQRYLLERYRGGRF